MWPDVFWPLEGANSFNPSLPLVPGSDPYPGRTIAVAPGKTITGVNARLARTGAITGTISQQGGGDVTELCVVADNGSANSLQRTTTLAAANGAYEISGLAPGPYTVYVRDITRCPSDARPLSTHYSAFYFGQTASPASATPVTVGSQQRTSSVDITLPAGFANGPCSRDHPC